MGTVTGLATRRHPRLTLARPPVYTPAETALRLGVPPKTLYRWDPAGKLRVAFRTPGNHRRYDKSVVDALAGGRP